MQIAEKQGARLRRIQFAQSAMMAISPFPAIYYSRHYLDDPTAFYPGLGLFLQMLAIELFLTAVVCVLMYRVYKSGPRWSLKNRRIFVWSCIGVVLTFYVLNIYILILLFGIIFIGGLSSIVWAARLSKEQ